MSAERLRQAATVLRERGEAATPGTWVVGTMVITDQDGIVEACYVGVEGDDGPFAIAPEVMPSDADYIALMSPPVALALADWLDVTAQDCGTSSLTFHGALAVADAILGGQR